jgi:predicted  nucleic acid-binding Zn-ribbon protein
MNQQIRHLVEIQELDKEIQELQEQINRYPGIWEEIKADLAKKTESLAQATRAITSHEEERRKVEQEMRLAGEKLVSYQAQQMLVKTSKELAAISSQIDNLKKRIDRLQEVGTSLLNEDENVRVRVATAEKALAEAKQKAREERDRIRKQVNTKKERIAALQADRAKIVGATEGDFVSSYDQVRRRWDVNPVVPVRNGSCTGCHFALLANRLVELHREEGIVYCDNCGRILSEDETFEAVTAE